MDKGIIRTGNQTLQVSSQNWQQSWESLPVRADTPAEVITGMNVPALSQLGKNGTGGMFGMTAFKLQFTNLVEFLGAGMNEHQVRECAELAYQEYYWFTIAELKQFIQRVKTGYYTSHKNFSAGILMEFLSEYAVERLRYRYDHYSQQKPKRRLVLPIGKISNDTGRRIAQKMCLAIGQRNQYYIEQMKDIVGRVVDGMTAEELSEEEYKQIRAEYYKQKKLNESNQQ